MTLSTIVNAMLYKEDKEGITKAIGTSMFASLKVEGLDGSTSAS